MMQHLVSTLILSLTINVSCIKAFYVYHLSPLQSPADSTSCLDAVTQTIDTGNSIASLTSPTITTRVTSWQVRTVTITANATMQPSSLPYLTTMSPDMVSAYPTLEQSTCTELLETWTDMQSVVGGAMNSAALSSPVPGSDTYVNQSPLSVTTIPPAQVPSTINIGNSAVISDTTCNDTHSSNRSAAPTSASTNLQPLATTPTSISATAMGSRTASASTAPSSIHYTSGAKSPHLLMPVLLLGLLSRFAIA